MLILPQASFTALNIIPDEHEDDEIDNTKELQAGYPNRHLDLR